MSNKSIPVIMFAKFPDDMTYEPVATFANMFLAKQYLKKSKNKRGNFKQASLLCGADRNVRLVPLGRAVPHNPILGEVTNVTS